MSTPSAPEPTGLQFLFARRLDGGEVVKYTWPVDSRIFRTLVVEAGTLSARTLGMLLQRALQSGSRYTGASSHAALAPAA